MGVGTSETSQAPVTDWFEQKSCAHVVQFYTDDAVLVDAAARFVGAALGAGDAAVVIAARGHREGIAERLRAAGIDIALARRQSRYVAFDAEETLAKFMVKDCQTENSSSKL
ncbi:MAG: MEDS domain-containing protein [Candidatus Acidiferrales bacterium]